MIFIKNNRANMQVVPIGEDLKKIYFDEKFMSQLPESIKGYIYGML